MCTLSPLPHALCYQRPVHIFLDVGLFIAIQISARPFVYRKSQRPRLLSLRPVNTIETLIVNFRPPPYYQHQTTTTTTIKDTLPG